MNSDPLPTADDKQTKTAALIQTLMQAGQRLEELTEGEVDSVMDSHGRTMLLPNAQAHLIANEAVRQRAIINTLPANIALLDKDGFILAVNQSWRQFGRNNASGAISAINSNGSEVGLNYPVICDRATGPDAAGAPEVATAIRSILSGELANYSLEYPCHSPTVKRWFLLTVRPIAEGNQKGAVVMHLDITERKLGEQSLQRLVNAMDAIGDAVYLVDRASMSMVHVNDAACRLHRQSCEKLLTWSPWRILGISREALEHIYDILIESGVAAKPVEIMRRRHDGTTLWLELRSHAQRTEERWTIVTLVRDITERKSAETRIRRLNRVYAMQSKINALIVRVRDRDDLFRSACQIAVDAGGFRMAWIGIIDSAAMKIVPIGQAGLEPEFLTVVKDRMSLREDSTARSTMSVRAVKEKQALVLNEIREDSSLLFAQKRLAQGVHSMAFLPLMIGDDAVGVMTLYAEEIGFFDSEEMKLLIELAGNVAFAVDHIEKQERLEYLAYYDVLTGMANRRLFLERVAQYMRTAGSQGHKLAVFLIDIERFKNINDTLGRTAGDALLIQVAEWITHKVGDANLVARIAADQFAVVLPEVRPDGNLTQLLENAMAGFSEHPFHLSDAVLRIGMKIGAAIYPDDGVTTDALFKNAEAGLKKAKAGGDHYLFYTPKMTDSVARELTLENQLRQALEKEEFILHYQPKVSLANGRVTGAEALIRWNNPRTGLVPPGHFIPILEETGLIYDVGRWALSKAISDYLRWRTLGLAAVPVSVNVSPLQLGHRKFVSEIEAAIGIDPDAAAGLELEITESVIMANVTRSIASLQAIRALNVTIAIDDFGTGFSSLSYLSKLPVDTLKIDRSFVDDITRSQEGLALVSTVINLAHSMRLNVVAEGVETEEQRRLLHLLRCDEFQGFLFSKAVPVNVFESQFLAPLGAHPR